MAILVYLAVTVWRAFLGVLVAVLEWVLDNGKVIFGLLAVIAIAGLIYLAVKRNQYELELLASGTCEPVMEQLYTPPPTQTCTARNDKGSCIAWRTDYPIPYMRTLVRCEGAEDFWRRTSSIPKGSFK